MIIIGGDSWGAGEFEDGTGNILHAGITQYLTDNGISAINLSKPGGGNREAILSIKNFFITNQHLIEFVQGVVIFQTEWTRDTHLITDEQFKNAKSIHELESISISKYYYELCDLKSECGFKCPITVLGGISDTVKLDQFEQEYPGVKIAIPSVTNFLLNKNFDPVYSLWIHNSEELVKKIKHQRPDLLEETLNLMDKGNERYNVFYDNKELFWPDGLHPNRKAHKLLYNELMKLNIFSYQVASGSSHSKYSASSNLL